MPAPHLCIVDALVQQRDGHIVSVVDDMPAQNQVHHVGNMPEPSAGWQGCQENSRIYMWQDDKRTSWSRCGRSCPR